MNSIPWRAAHWQGARDVVLAVAGVTFFTLAAAAQVAPQEKFVSGPLHVATQLPLALREQNFTWTGSVTSQGDAVLGGPLARSSFGVSGSGIKVGIISDSFNFLGGQAAGIASGDLPGPGNPGGRLPPVNIVSDEFFPGNLDEGRAIAEIVHDLAPGAEILFHSAFNNPQSSPGGSIAAAINNLVAAGANVIIDDVFSVGAPAYQDGVAAPAVNNAFASGVAYFSSAGNNFNNAYEGIYSPLGFNHNFDANFNEGSDLLLNFGSIPDGGSRVAGPG